MLDVLVCCENDSVDVMQTVNNNNIANLLTIVGKEDINYQSTSLIDAV